MLICSVHRLAFNIAHHLNFSKLLQKYCNMLQPKSSSARPWGRTAAAVVSHSIISILAAVYDMICGVICGIKQILFKAT